MPTTINVKQVIKIVSQKLIIYDIIIYNVKWIDNSEEN